MAVYKKRVAALCAVAATHALPAFAAHPLQTEDTGTQGAGNVELENGFSWTRSAASKVFLYQPQVSYGVTPSVDVIVQPSWLDSRQADSRQHGFGDTNVDAKWRFFGVAPVSFAVRAGATLASSEHGFGLDHGKVSVHALTAMTIDAAPFTFHANLGGAENPHQAGLREHIGIVSGAVMWAPNESLIWTLDAGSASNPDPTRAAWVATLLGGAIYTVRPGLDLDVGWQSTVGGNPSAREWLVGITYRFAP